MNVPPFDPTQVVGYGTSGQESAKKMADSLISRSLLIKYDSNTKKFTILGSSEINKEVMEKIFAENTYHNWQPEVLDETDEFGNRLVQLRAITNVYGPHFKPRGGRIQERTRIVARTSFQPSREGLATELVSNIENYLHVVLSNKTCLDVGCRSGENAIAMQRSGAIVTGIDPDDSEFFTAESKGMKRDQLFKATLQEFHATFPNQKFDVATVFLWQIKFKERESFAKSLSSIIKSDGFVIISYQDEQYDSGPSSVLDLMRGVFFSVAKFKFDGWNRYILKCSYPRT